MRKYVVLILIFITNVVYAQKIETDIFNNLKYQSRHKDYEAYLKKDALDDLIFSDNKENKITFKKQYLELEFGDIFDNAQNKISFFQDLVNRYNRDEKYEATYSIDVFGKIVIQDNRNNKVEVGKDIFGNSTYSEKVNGNEISISKDLTGVYNYKSKNASATLKEDIFHQWVYQDSKANKLEFSAETWNNLQNRYGSNENILMFLIDEFLGY